MNGYSIGKEANVSILFGPPFMNNAGLQCACVCGMEDCYNLEWEHEKTKSILSLLLIVLCQFAARILCDGWSRNVARKQLQLWDILMERFTPTGRLALCNPTDLF